MDDDYDPMPAILAQVDQTIATAPHIARMAHGYYQAFADEGFTDKQALYLTATQLHGTPGTSPA